MTEGNLEGRSPPRLWDEDTKHVLLKYVESRLGGVMVSVLTTGPKGHGFKPSQGDGFLRAIKICSTPSFRR
jgi:hypothetical protein